MRHQPSSPTLCSSLFHKVHEVCVALVGVRFLQALLVGRSFFLEVSHGGRREEAHAFCRTCLQNCSETTHCGRQQLMQGDRVLILYETCIKVHVLNQVLVWVYLARVLTGAVVIHYIFSMINS